MTVKQILQKLQKVLPSSWLYLLQDIHSYLMFRWILKVQSQPLNLSSKSAMVFSPHQDDETFGCGGAIALKREQGTPVTVVFLTDGQGSGGAEALTKEKIIEIRKAEAEAALNILGVPSSDIHFLDRTDGTLRDLQGDSKQRTIAQIVELLQRYKPEEIYVPHCKDCHRDHEATYTLVREAITHADIEVDLLQYAIWMFWRSPLFIMLKLEDIAQAYRLNITPVQTQKKQAIASYYSQLRCLPRSFVKRFQGSYEIFFKVES
ncbi:LmbE family protein [Calothrix sp. NIES-4101]|nr:LmbE family protein [Calothrix sp. NIES-4101]